MAGYTSLVDIWTSRSDLQQAFPQGTVVGTVDNQKLNAWWNQYGVKEYPGVTLVPPGDNRIQDPKKLTAEAQQSTTPSGTTGTQETTQPKSTDECTPGTTKVVGNVLQTCTSFQGQVPTGSVMPGAKWQDTKILTQTEQRNYLQTGSITGNANITTGSSTTQPQTPMPTNINEYTAGEKLGLVYQQDAQLQALYDTDGNGKAGTSAAGTTIWDWAITVGYKDPKYSSILVDYSPKNVVKAAYQNLFARNPFAEGDAGAQDWVNAIESGYITSWNDLLGKMQIDPGAEWSNLSDAQKYANIINYQDLVQDVPEFSKFFPEASILSDIQKEVDTYYDKEKANYIKDKETTESRTIENWTRYTTQLTQQERQDMDSAQLQFADAIYNATTNQAALGTIFSSLRQQQDKKLRDALARQKDIIALKAEQQKNELDINKQRTLDDLETKQQEYLTKLEKTKKTEVEQTFASKESRALQQYQIAVDLAQGIQGTQNVYGQAIGTPAGQFTIPTDTTKTSAQQTNELFGGITPSTTITCPTGQKLVNGVCVSISTSTAESTGLSSGTISEAEYQAYQKSKL